MNISGNTILITGGGSGIGRGLAEALAKEGNEVIIAGRRKAALDEVIAATPHIKSVALDIDNEDDIRAVAGKLAADFPKLNVLINNAGIMRPENVQAHNLSDAEAMVITNILGPIRLTSALLTHVAKQPHATIINVSSGLAFLPLAMTPTYCATKAAIHSYTQSLRWQLKGTKTEVIELILPYVQTHLMGPQQAEDSRAMPLADFIKEVVQILKTQPTVTEVCVENVKPLRFAAETGKFDAIFKGLNESMPAH